MPSFPSSLVADLPDGKARDLVSANLADEKGDRIPHVDLFERFAEAVGGESEGASPATSNLLGTYEQLLETGPDAALAGFVAYEYQSSEIAARKAEGLRPHYGLDGRAVSFWERHVYVDARHGEWAQRAIAECDEGQITLVPFARRAADAWWSFLDEREGLARAS